MKPRSEKIADFILKNISQYPQNLAAITAKHFGISRTSVHRHIDRLVHQNKIIKSGDRRQVRYMEANAKEKSFVFKRHLSESDVWDKYISSNMLGLPENVFEIIHYGFTEIFNNAIEHSASQNIFVSIQQENDKIQIIIQDKGMGIFERISQTYHFSDYKECLLHLTKGKLTTDPINHTGEGLFFTSRLFDECLIEANGIGFYRNNLLEDWSVEKSSLQKGTKVSLTLSKNSKRKIIDIFSRHTNLETLKFDKTELLVDLSQLEGERLISRSQAKRLLSRLEPFDRVTLDFSKVAAVGQGFVDEIFRVYPLKHPCTIIHYIHANEEVEFMIKRGLDDKPKNR